MSEKIVITEAEAVKLMRNTKGKLFSVVFEKRTKPGVIRRMVCRTGVRKGVSGEGQSFNPADHSLLTVHEFVTIPDTTRGQRGRFVGNGNMGTQFRHVAFEGIRTLRIAGKEYEIVR